MKEKEQIKKDIEFLERRKDSRDKIISTFNIHESVFGVLGGVDKKSKEE